MNFQTGTRAGFHARPGNKPLLEWGATIAATPSWCNPSHTVVVRIAVSVPDDLFRLAEATARRLRVSRSELYARALAEFLKQQDGSRITERLNEIYSQHAATVDPGLHRAQLKSLEKETW